MISIREFTNIKFGTVSAITENGTIWFLANDVANILGYAAARNAVLAHTSEDDRKILKYKACTESVQAKFWAGNDYSDKTFINESGLYCLIFGSKLESAKDFKVWVTGTVLPSLRQNGGYIMGQENLPEPLQDTIKSQTKEMSIDVAKLSAKYAKRTEQWHQKNAEVKELKSEKKNLKKTIKVISSDLDYSDNLYSKLIDEIAGMQEKIDRLESAVNLERNVTSKAIDYLMAETGTNVTKEKYDIEGNRLSPVIFKFNGTD